MGDSARKKLLDSALKSLLVGFELSPWVKVPATFASEVASRFRSLPESNKKAVNDTTEHDLRKALANIPCDNHEQLYIVFQDATYRAQVLDYLFGLSPPAVDEIVTRVGALKYVTKDAPVARRISELIDFVESMQGPGLEAIVDF